MRRTLLALAAVLPAFAVEVVNHHPFPIRQPMTLGAETVMVDVGANETKTLSATASPAILTAAADRDGLRLMYRGQNAGGITWSLTLNNQFMVVPLQFKSARPAPLFTEWEAKADRKGIN